MPYCNCRLEEGGYAIKYGTVAITSCKIYEVSPIKYSFQAFNWALLRGTYTTALLEDLELDTPASVTSNIGILIGVFMLCARKRGKLSRSWTL